VEALGMAAGMSREAVHSQLCSAVDVVIHLRRGPAGRRVAEVAVLERTPDGLAVATPAVRFDDQGGAVTLPGADALGRLL
jgi:pilus assembly protein CpaF